MGTLFRKPIILIAGLSAVIFAILFVVLKNIISVEVVAIAVAWLVGMLAVLQVQIKNFFFPPVLKIKIEEVITTINGGWEEKWYNLVIQNKGYSVAENIRVKIRDREHKSWINLLRPFAGMREDKIFVHMIAVGEDEAFNIGHSDSRNNTFELATNLIPNNQKIVLQSEESHTYFVSIVSDNINPKFIKIKINNVNYPTMSLSNIDVVG